MGREQKARAPPSSFLLSPHFPRVLNAKRLLAALYFARTGMLATQASQVLNSVEAAVKQPVKFLRDLHFKMLCLNLTNYDHNFENLKIGFMRSHTARRYETLKMPSLKFNSRTSIN